MPFSLRGNYFIHQNLRHSSVFVDMCMKNVEKLLFRAELKIGKLLPQRFAKDFVSWKDGGTHYVSIFSNFPAKRSWGCDTAFVVTAFMEGKNYLSAEEHYKYLKFVLFVYNRTPENAVALIGNNIHSSWEFDKQLGPIFVVCHSHRFKLAVMDIMAGYDKVIKRVHSFTK